MPRGSLTIDIKDSSQLRDLNVGDDIEVTVKGKVQGLEAPETVERPSMEPSKGKSKTKKEKIPGFARIKVSSIKIQGRNEFSDLAEDDEDDD